ncbi:MAG: hypothetical protein LBJ11_05035 [Oscillospiraceae bacterium]|nr:hypothetical protein [Oscillospiraceae bacterium]
MLRALGLVNVEILQEFEEKLRSRKSSEPFPISGRLGAYVSDFRQRFNLNDQRLVKRIINQEASDYLESILPKGDCIYNLVLKNSRVNLTSFGVLFCERVGLRKVFQVTDTPRFII